MDTYIIWTVKRIDLYIRDVSKTDTGEKGGEKKETGRAGAAMTNI